MKIFSSYPSSFIDNQFENFFSQYIGTSSFLPYIYQEHQFTLIHHKIFGEPTPRQSQVAMSAATANLDNDQTDEDVEQRVAKETTQTTETKQTSYGRKLFIHYTHEKRFRPFKRDLHQVYDNVFKGTPVMDVKLIVGNRNRRDAKNELIRKRPKPSLLQNKSRQIKNKYLKFLGKLSFS